MIHSTTHSRTVVAAAMLSIVLIAGCGENNDYGSSDVVDAISEPRASYGEEEFARDSEVRADPQHVVVLRLESQREGGDRANIIRYRFDEASTHTFCIPQKEPYIRSMELVSEDGATAINVARGECATQTVEPGLYQMIVRHDAQAVPRGGATAFIHVPRTKAAPSENLGAVAASAPFETPPCQGIPADAGQDRPRSAFQLHDGRWLFPGTDSQSTVQVHASSVVDNDSIDLISGGWSACKDLNGNYRIATRLGNGQYAYMYHESQTINGTSVPIIGTVGLVDIFNVADLGNFQFTLQTAQNDFPVYVGTDNLVHWSTSNPPQQPTTLTNALTYYPAGAAVPDLLPGEVALTHNCNYDTSKGTWVVRASIPDVGKVAYSNPYTGERLTLPVFGGMGHPGDSMRLGPDTVLQTFRNTKYTGELTYVGESQSCVWFQDTTQSFKIVLARQWILSTNECNYCNLTNADLSGIDFTLGSLQQSTLVGADLSNTIYRNARLDYANFSGATTRLTNANFHDAILYGGSFRGADLTKTNMQSDDPVKPQQLDMSSATLNIDTMFPQHWRYNDMTGVVFTDSQGAVVSSTSSPLDLSGARLSHATMPGIVLTAANLSGANFSGADLTGADLGSVVAGAGTPATFNRAALIHAYMKSVSLSGSFFRGAVMSPVNLAGADLSGAWFEDDGTDAYGAANLASSFMLDTKLNNAHMTNVTLDFVSWYNVDPSNLIATGAGAFLTGASFNLADLPGLDLKEAHLQGATLTNTQLIGADLTDARLDRNGTARTNLSTANLRGADLTGANLGYANLLNAGAAPAAEDEVFIEVLKDPDHFQKTAEYQYFAVNRPATNLGAGGVSANTESATCPNGITGSCGPITAAAWVATSPPIEPTDCMPSAYDSQGNVIAITCSSSRHPSGG